MIWSDKFWNLLWSCCIVVSICLKKRRADLWNNIIKLQLKCSRLAYNCQIKNVLKNTCHCRQIFGGFWLGSSHEFVELVKWKLFVSAPGNVVWTKKKKKNSVKIISIFNLRNLWSITAYISIWKKGFYNFSTFHSHLLFTYNDFLVRTWGHMHF